MAVLVRGWHPIATPRRAREEMGERGDGAREERGRGRASRGRRGAIGARGLDAVSYRFGADCVHREREPSTGVFRFDSSASVEENHPGVGFTNLSVRSRKQHYCDAHIHPEDRAGPA